MEATTHPLAKVRTRLRRVILNIARLDGQIYNFSRLREGQSVYVTDTVAGAELDYIVTDMKSQFDAILQIDLDEDEVITKHGELVEDYDRVFNHVFRKWIKTARSLRKLITPKNCNQFKPFCKQIREAKSILHPNYTMDGEMLKIAEQAHENWKAGRAIPFLPGGKLPDVE